MLNLKLLLSIWKKILYQAWEGRLSIQLKDCDFLKINSKGLKLILWINFFATKNWNQYFRLRVMASKEAISRSFQVDYTHCRWRQRKIMIKIFSYVAIGRYRITNWYCRSLSGNCSCPFQFQKVKNKFLRKIF